MECSYMWSRTWLSKDSHHTIFHNLLLVLWLQMKGSSSHPLLVLVSLPQIGSSVHWVHSNIVGCCKLNYAHILTFWWNHTCVWISNCVKFCMCSKVNIRVHNEGNKAICDSIIVKFTCLEIDFQPHEFQKLCLLLNM